MNSKKLIPIATGLALLASMAIAIPVFAQTNNDNGANQSNGGASGQGRWNGMMGGQGGLNRGLGTMRPGVFGKVTAVNGNIITVSGNSRPMPKAAGSTDTKVTPPVAVIYAVDATNATVKKNNATSTVSSIAVGDMIAVQGTVTGTNVVATSIFDGVVGRMGVKNVPGNQGDNGKDSQGHMASTSPILGNGQPVIAGTISAVNGNALTVTTTSNVTYTVDASGAKIVRGQNTIVLSGVAIGDKVLIQGTVNGTSVVASTVVDQSTPAAVTPAQGKGQSRGFLGGIGQFFMHLFGF